MPYLDGTGVQNMASNIRTLADQTYLSYAGGTLSGDVIVETASNPKVGVKSSAYSAKIGDDVPSSGVWLGEHVFYDKNGDACGYDNVYRTASDQLRRGFEAQRKNASDNTITHAFFHTIDADGSLGVAFSSNDSRDAWVAGLGLDNTPTDVSETVSVSSATDTTICLTGILDIGVYMVSAYVSFGANSSGRRHVHLATTTSGSAIDNWCQITQAPSNAQPTILQVNTIINHTASGRLYLRCYQNSGSALSCTGGIRTLLLHH